MNYPIHKRTISQQDAFRGRGSMSKQAHEQLEKGKPQSACFKTYDRTRPNPLAAYDIVPTREIKSPPKDTFVTRKSGGQMQHSLEKHLLKFDDVGNLDKSVKLTSRFGEAEKPNSAKLYEGFEEYNTLEFRMKK